MSDTNSQKDHKAATDSAHAASSAKEHVGKDDHGHDYGPEVGRYVSHPPELPNFIQIGFAIEQSMMKEGYMTGRTGPEPKVVERWIEKDPETGEWVAIEGESPTPLQVLHIGTNTKPLPLIGYAPWENHVFLLIGAIVTVMFFWCLTKNLRRNFKEAIRKPTRGQVVAEEIVGGFDSFVEGVLGKKYSRQYLPYIGTLFFFVLFCNLLGLVPLMKPPTAYIVITASLSLCTFLFVQATAWLRLGPFSYLYHMAGQPKDFTGWLFSPLLFALEVVSDFFAKPASLALRLFGNMLGKDILMGAFLSMGIGVIAALPVVGGVGSVIGLPLTYPFYFLGLLLSAIQALVFALLSTIYIMLVLPHEHEHGHDDDHGHEDHGHGAAAHAH
jgi:F-type H+-transporting ATPase subunit a